MKKFAILAGLAALSCAASANLLSNAGFEDGDVAFTNGSVPWSTEYTYASNNNGDPGDPGSIYHEGNLRVMTLANNGSTGHLSWDPVSANEGQYFLAVNGATMTDPSPFVLTQDFANQGLGTQLTISLDSVNLYAPGGEGGTSTLEVFLDGVSLGTTNTFVDNVWRTATFTGTTLSEGPTSQLKIVSNTSQASGNDFGLDNLSVAPVPEPASMAVLGLGALGIIRRRRAKKA